MVPAEIYDKVIEKYGSNRYQASEYRFELKKKNENFFVNLLNK